MQRCFRLTLCDHGVDDAADFKAAQRLAWMSATHERERAARPMYIYMECRENASW